MLSAVFLPSSYPPRLLGLQRKNTRKEERQLFHLEIICTNSAFYYLGTERLRSSCLFSLPGITLPAPSRSPHLPWPWHCPLMPSLRLPVYVFKPHLPFRSYLTRLHLATFPEFSARDHQFSARDHASHSDSCG